MKLLLTIYGFLSFQTLVFGAKTSIKENNSILVKAIRSPLVKSMLMDALAYIASPLFMPIAISRALKAPPGLGAQANVVNRFGRYLRNNVPFKKTSERKQNLRLVDDFMQKLTKHRVNTILTMKQFRELERREKLEKAISSHY